MKHFGPEPPWRGRSHNFGSWRWVPPSPDSWFDESGYWEWFAPPATLAGWVNSILADYYVPAIQAELNRELSILTMCQVEKGTPLPTSHAGSLYNASIE